MSFAYSFYGLPFYGHNDSFAAFFFFSNFWFAVPGKTRKVLGNLNTSVTRKTDNFLIVTRITRCD